MNLHVAPPKADEGAPTPVMAQYLETKAAHPDCILFYRMGDFYEIFFEDAEVAARTLNIVLTKRGKHLGRDIPLCGVPATRAEEYLQRLIAAGLRVAVCEQMETLDEAKRRGGSKAVVRRDVVRLVTPGTVTEELLLDPSRESLLVALTRLRAPDASWEYGLAAVDISTGRFDVATLGARELAAELARLDPREVVMPEGVRHDADLAALWRDCRHALTPLPREPEPHAAAERRLAGRYGVSSLDAFGTFTRAEVAAAAYALAYVERTQVAASPRLAPPTRATDAATLRIDPSTRASLEIARTQSGERRGSLLAAVDATVTAPGARLLAARLSGPSTDLALIGSRHDAVEALLGEDALRGEVRRRLRGAPDVARAVQRLALGRGGPRDLACVRDGIQASLEVAALVGEGAPGELAAHASTLAASDAGLARRLAACLADELPLHARDGGFVREGFDPELDEARRLGTDFRQAIAAMEQTYVALTGCRTLRIKSNGLVGYYVEVPPAAGEAILRGELRETFTHKQTMTGAMRFTTAEVAGLEARIATSGDTAKAIEAGHFERLSAEVLAAFDGLSRSAEALAAVDVACSFAEVARRDGWTRPMMEDGLAFDVRGGRHPVVEEALRASGEAFVANDCDLSGTKSGRIVLVTGPNMGGKSTFLRQNALMAVLAQAGGYVPATHARLGLVDRLFSRVGAADDLARGRSTFMVEMVETAAILNQATARSLVVLDEIGRGTATHDGLSIAWAAVEYLHERNGCRALFATHFHELTTLDRTLARVSNATLRVTEHQGEVVFLHEVVPGVAERSYGLHVARLAGLPPEVVQRATAVMAELEKGADKGRRKGRPLPVEELPLFAAAVPPSPPKADPLRDMLAGVDPDAMTPRQALEALYRIKEAAGA